MARPRLVRRRDKPEDREVQQILHLLSIVNARVYISGTRRRRGKVCPSCGAFVINDDHSTHQTSGIPDIEAFVPPPPAMRNEPGAPTWWLLKIEAKAPGNGMSPAQKVYQALCHGAPAGVHHIVGGYNAVLAWFVRYGYVKAENVPHYRREAVGV